MWFRRRKEKSVDLERLDAVEPVEALRALARENGLDIQKLKLSIPLGKGGTEFRIQRNELWVNDHAGNALWRVDALRPLFRGNRQPPSDEEMGHYPPEYVMFFYGIESNVRLFCALTRPPTDAEFLDLYTQMRRRPDGRSLGPLHDVIWQSAALALGLRPWSEAEYDAVFGQLARSARHFKIGPSSRNYLAYVQTIGRAAQQGE
ncbi:MAG: hypothetical protein FJ225_13390 [Lentisphaerae bacterium]|nr:hypothetical protein [Lentisphaerota bacterium]